MVSLLTSLKQKKNRNLKQQPNTVRRELLRYTGHLLAIFIFIVIASLGAYSIIATARAKENNMVFLVNDFYNELQETEELLYNCVVEQDGDVENNLLKARDSQMQLLEQLADLKISTSFHRDIEDLSQIMQQYCIQMGNIQNYLLIGENFSLISQTYSEANTLYLAAKETFRFVYEQMIAYCQKYDTRAKRNMACYLVVLLFVAALLIYDMFWQIYSIEQSITRPVQQLMEELYHTDLEQFQHRNCICAAPEANDDIRLLIECYNSMLQEIQKQLLQQKEYVNMKLKLQEQEVLNLKIGNELKKSQLANLQSQINPHFLFNTLNMISHSAYMENDHKTVTLLETTSDLLRYSLDYSDKTVSLDLEMRHLGDYVYLQEQRFGDRIRFRFELDETFHDVQLPNLILQPLVENAISHGVGMYTDGGVITIQTEYLPEQKMGRISIIDNGEGMDEQTLQQVDSQMRSRLVQTGKIGLSNVFVRLSVFFDGKADIQLYSVPHERTEIRLLIPYEKEN